MNTLPVQKYDLFGQIGFQAGIILKNVWERPDSIYDFLENDVMPERKMTIVPKQVHGSDISFIQNITGTGEIAADGVISKGRDYCLTVRTADCLPLLFADADSGILGAVHVGWRGLVGGIIENLIMAVKNLDINFNRSYISLGPAIGSCCYEVGSEIAVLFDDGFVTVKNDRYYLDIRGALKEKLISLGFGNGRILDFAECTGCNSDKYYSFRRDGRAPIQMVSFIYGI